MAEIMKSGPGIEISSGYRWLVVAAVEVRVPERAAVRRREHERISCVRSLRQVLAQFAGQTVRDLDATTGVGLRRPVDQLAVDLLR